MNAFKKGFEARVAAATQLLMRSPCKTTATSDLLRYTVVPAAFDSGLRVCAGVYRMVVNECIPHRLEAQSLIWQFINALKLELQLEKY
jgi:hypothetical protein